jgi:hypothetical protein
MPATRAEFVFGAEIECLTCVPDQPESLADAVSLFVRTLADLAPALPATQGIFTPYAKIYADLGHIELALIECHDPLLLTSIFERVQILASQAVQRLASQGIRLILANNSHSGLLHDGCPVWGHHENYLVEQNPEEFTQSILPFLVTRLYQGAGGLHYPTGNYLAAVRPVRMKLATGGGTTEMRAIHSTAREEHHMGRRRKRFRYHQILGDGHRSHFNLALQFGATALALKAILFDSRLETELDRVRGEFSDDWVGTLQALNVLATPDTSLHIHPLVLKTQRIYLDAARRYVDTLDDVPGWIPRILADWQDTLQAYQRLDRAWLSARLDAFAKYEFYSAVLRDTGYAWQDLPGKDQVFCELALLDHSYHEFCNPESVFSRMDSSGLLQHRVTAHILPGREPEPFVPETATRARTRARFIRDHQGCSQYRVDWSCIYDTEREHCCLLTDPFATNLGAWSSDRQRRAVRLRGRHDLDECLHGVRTAFAHGQYELADTWLRELERLAQPTHGAVGDVFRYRACLQARRGFTDGPAYLDRLHGARTEDLRAITDYCCVHRFRGLVPDLQGMEPWICRGLASLDSGDVETAVAFRDHVACALVRHGQVGRALEMLSPALGPPGTAGLPARVRGSLLATAGEVFRRMGDRRRAGRCLEDAVQIQLADQNSGLLSDVTYASLAKWERSRRRALTWLARAAAIQSDNGHRLGHANSLLLEARLRRGRRRAESARETILSYRTQLPALAECPGLERILRHWDEWVAGAVLPDADDFWGL